MPRERSPGKRRWRHYETAGGRRPVLDSIRSLSDTPRDEAPDALDEMIAEFMKENPDFPALLQAAERRRALLRTLAEQRKRRNLSQTKVAAAMNTSQPTLARLETTAADTKLSTIERFAAALGYSIEYHLVPATKSQASDGRSRRGRLKLRGDSRG